MTRWMPRHEQHYPDHLLPTRLQEYVSMNPATPPTRNRAAAIRVTGQQTLDAVLAAQKELGIASIDARYFVSTCFHEAGCTNEIDTEVASPTCTPGFISVGAYQIGEEEARRFGYTLEDMLDFEKATKCMVRLADANLTILRGYINKSIGKPDVEDYTDPSGTSWTQGGVRAYLAIGHNHGMGYVRATIGNYGLNWTAYKVRNPQDRIVSNHYGEDCVTGGPYYPGKPDVKAPGHRVIQLTHPFTTGEDVKELQRHLHISDDGVFGPATEAALKLFQRGEQLTDDGICGDATWTALLSA